MNEYERYVRVLRREPVDRAPWVARMVLWHRYHQHYGTLPERYRGWSLWDIQRDLGVGVLARVRPYRKVYRGAEVIERQDGDLAIAEYRTPVGTVRTVQRFTPELAGTAESGYEVVKMIEDGQGYEVVEYLLEHLEVVPNYEACVATQEALGGDGVALPLIDRAPFQEFYVKWAGCEQAAFELYDRTQRVERLLEVATQVYRERIWPACAACPGPVIESPDNLCGRMTGPRLFQRYLAPYYREFAAYLHRHGKLLATHLDGEPSTLLDVIKDSGLDVIEAFTPRPMTRATVGDAQKVWGDAIVIWGGVASTVLCPETTSDEEFQSSVEEALGAARRGHAFILGVGDNIMPEASLDRVRRIRELLED